MVRKKEGGERKRVEGFQRKRKVETKKQNFPFLENEIVFLWFMSKINK